MPGANSTITLGCDNHQLNGQVSVYHNRVIHVHMRKGKDSETCLTGHQAGDQYCKSIEFVASKLQNSRSRNVAITFSNHGLLTIQGKDMYLNCNCNKLIAYSFTSKA